MKLTLENCEEQKWIKPLFENVTRELGIDKEDWHVVVRLENYYFSAGSCCYDHAKNPKTVLVQLDNTGRLGKSQDGDRFFTMPEVFCHELVHVKQHIRDGLENELSGCWYRGDFYPHAIREALERVVGPAKCCPWEEEAYGRMFILCDKCYGGSNV